MIKSPSNLEHRISTNFKGIPKQIEFKSIFSPDKTLFSNSSNFFTQSNTNIFQKSTTNSSFGEFSNNFNHIESQIYTNILELPKLPKNIKKGCKTRIKLEKIDTSLNTNVNFNKPFVNLNFRKSFNLNKNKFRIVEKSTSEKTLKTVTYEVHNICQVRKSDEKESKIEKENKSLNLNTNKTKNFEYKFHNYNTHLTKSLEQVYEKKIDRKFVRKNLPERLLTNSCISNLTYSTTQTKEELNKITRNFTKKEKEIFNKMFIDNKTIKSNVDYLVKPKIPNSTKESKNLNLDNEEEIINNINQKLKFIGRSLNIVYPATMNNIMKFYSNKTFLEKLKHRVEFKNQTNIKLDDFYDKFTESWLNN